MLQPDGTRARKYAYGSTWIECDEKRQELIGRDRAGIPTPTRSMKPAEWLPYWLDNIVKPRRKRTTYVKYETHVRLYLVPRLGKRSLEKLGVQDVRQAPAGISAATTAATAQEAHRVSAMTAACREELITLNVVSLVEAPVVDSYKIGTAMEIYTHVPDASKREAIALVDAMLRRRR